MAADQANDTLRFRQLISRNLQATADQTQRYFKNKDVETTYQDKKLPCLLYGYERNFSWEPRTYKVFYLILWLLEVWECV